MKTKLITAVALVAASSLALAGCATNEGSTNGGGLSGTLTGKGASSQKAAQEKWVADFQTANTGVTVNYSPDGSGAGREAFTAGAAAFAGSDRALKAEELGAGKFAGCAADSSALDLPVYISPIAVIFNVEGVKDLTLTPQALAGIFSGKITKWNDPAITATNPDAKLPAAAINPVHRADDSGTTENFTDTMNVLAPSVWTWEADGMWPDGLKGEAATGTSGVVQAVTTGTNMIGYADASQAGELGKAQLFVNGKAQAPTAEAAAAIVDNSPLEPGRDANDLAVALDRKAEGAYPAVLLSYAIVCQTYKDSATAELVKSYVGYMASADGQTAAAEAAGSAPLSASMQAKVKTAIDSVK